MMAISPRTVVNTDPSPRAVHATHVDYRATRRPESPRTAVKRRPVPRSPAQVLVHHGELDAAETVLTNFCLLNPTNPQGFMSANPAFPWPFLGLSLPFPGHSLRFLGLSLPFLCSLHRPRRARSSACLRRRLLCQVLKSHRQRKRTEQKLVHAAVQLVRCDPLSPLAWEILVDAHGKGAAATPRPSSTRTVLIDHITLTAAAPLPCASTRQRCRRPSMCCGR